MSHRRGDRGQAVVELALALPLVCMLLLAIVQMAVVVRDQLAVHLAAREAARAAAVAGAPAAAGATAALRTTELRPLDVHVVERNDAVAVTVRYVHHTDVPLVGLLLPDITLAATVTMGLEPP